MAEGRLRFCRDARWVECDRLTKRSSKVSTNGMVVSGVAPKIATKAVPPERDVSGQRWPQVQGQVPSSTHAWCLLDNP